MDNKLQEISKLVRYYILTSSTIAGSGHPTSSLSAVELLVTLFFSDHFRYDPDHPEMPSNDRFILSKGHASPLFYALWAVAGELTEEDLKTYRDFDSKLEGHPTMRFKHTEVATGSLGQGLSVGVGMALNAKYLDKLQYRTYVLLGDSEMAEGSNWEAIQIAAHYKLNNLIGIIDVNRLGQRGETMYGWDLKNYELRIKSFGWETFVVEDGHNLKQVENAYEQAENSEIEMPKMIIAKTIKGKGVSFLEDKEDWHGKVLSIEEFDKAIEEIGEVDKNIIGNLAVPEIKHPETQERGEIIETDADYSDPLATRKAYGHALVEMYPNYPEMVVLDAEVSNSTYSKVFKEKYPERFFEMFIAEQNMVGVAVGLYKRGKIPFVSTFASFFTRAMDQIRVSQYSKAGINFVGSHAGVSVGEDGPTQMGLEDIAVFRAILGSIVLYPADHISAEKLVYKMAENPGICYMRTTRMDTEPIYGENEEFEIGGSKVLRSSDNDVATIIAAGVTLYEALKAYDKLKEQGIDIRVIDIYSVKPIDAETIKKAARETKTIITVEDHFAQGGIGGAVLEALAQDPAAVYKLAVDKMPRSGKPEQLLSYMEIDSNAIVEKVMEILGD